MVTEITLPPLHSPPASIPSSLYAFKTINILTLKRSATLQMSIGGRKVWGNKNRDFIGHTSDVRAILCNARLNSPVQGVSSIDAGGGAVLYPGDYHYKCIVFHGDMKQMHLTIHKVSCFIWYTSTHFPYNPLMLSSLDDFFLCIYCCFIFK